MRTLSIIFVLLLVAACGRSRQSQPSMVMHRLQAGVPDSDGWCFASSTDGDFSVLLPIKFNDFTVRVKEEDGRVVTTYGLGSKDTDGIGFSAAEIPSSSRKKTGIEILESSRARGLVQESRTRIFGIGDGHAVEWLEQASDRGSYFRVIDYPRSSIILGITFPVSAAARVERCRLRFFDSLRLKGPNHLGRESPSPQR